MFPEILLYICHLVIYTYIIIFIVFISTYISISNSQKNTTICIYTHSIFITLCTLQKYFLTLFLPFLFKFAVCSIPILVGKGIHNNYIEIFQKAHSISGTRIEKKERTTNFFNSKIHDVKEISHVKILCGNFICFYICNT